MRRLVQPETGAHHSETLTDPKLTITQCHKLNDKTHIQIELPTFDLIGSVKFEVLLRVKCTTDIFYSERRKLPNRASSTLQLPCSRGEGGHT